MVETDASRVVEMAIALSAHEGAGPPPFGIDDVLRHGFGSEKRFDGLVAEQSSGETMGYALYHDSYNVGLGAPGLHMIDLFVEPAARRRGIAQGLMAEIARECARRGGNWVTWQSMLSNDEALAFYEAIGGRRFQAADFELGGHALLRLAAK